MFDAPFDPSLFVEIEKRMGMAELEKIKDIIYKVSFTKTYEKINLSQDENTKNENDHAAGDLSS